MFYSNEQNIFIKHILMNILNHTHDGRESNLEQPVKYCKTTVCTQLLGKAYFIALLLLLLMTNYNTLCKYKMLINLNKG